MFNVEKTIATKIRCHQRHVKKPDICDLARIELVIEQLRRTLRGSFVVLYYWSVFNYAYPWCNLVSARHLEIIADQCERALAVARGRPRSVFAVTLNTHV